MTAKIINRLPKFASETERKIFTICTKVLILGASEASVLTPIDTSVLLNSQYRNPPRREGSRIVGEVGYSAGYALPVHDKNNPQIFRRATAEKEFLRKGFENARANIDRIVREGMKA
jgi:hypothetical protein